MTKKDIIKKIKKSGESDGIGIILPLNPIKIADKKEILSVGIYRQENGIIYIMCAVIDKIDNFTWLHLFDDIELKMPQVYDEIVAQLENNNK